MRARLVALVLLAAPALADEQVWTWVDDKGEEHYTNDKSSIPDKFRGKAKTTAGLELSVVKAHDGTGTESFPSEPVPQLQPQVKLQPAPPLQRPTPDPVVITVPGSIRVVMFEASTNSASKTLNRAGVLDKLAADNPGVKVEHVEFSTAVPRAERLKVSQLPTILFLDASDHELDRTVGLVTLKELQQKLDKARGK